MAGKYERSRPRRRIPAAAVLALLAVLCLCAGSLLFRRSLPANVPTLPTFQETAAPPETTWIPVASLPPDATAAPTQVLATATIAAQGDLLMHKGILDSCKQEDGSYDFSSVFQYLKADTTAFDFTVANLETTFGGPDYPYKGNPSFNCPDALLDSLTSAGYDLLLTANNHASDTNTDGILRTVQQIRSAGLEALGTQCSEDEPRYSIADINGIRVGMLCYTYATNEIRDGQPSLNYKPFVAQPGLVNYFLEPRPDRFYQEVEAQLAAMKDSGAEATVLFIHWGKEYSLTENATQRTMAQKLCDLGIDVIIGGHPHVVQPMELLQSTVDPDHRTVCIYSVGNAVSNQMKDEDVAFASGHSEDGVLFIVSFEKDTNDSVYVADVNVLPTWVNRHSSRGTREYNILPLDISREDQWAEDFALTEEQLLFARESYDRTMAILEEGLAQCRAALVQPS